MFVRKLELWQITSTKKNIVTTVTGNETGIADRNTKAARKAVVIGLHRTPSSAGMIAVRNAVAIRATPASVIRAGTAGVAASVAREDTEPKSTGGKVTTAELTAATPVMVAKELRAKAGTVGKAAMVEGTAVVEAATQAKGVAAMVDRAGRAVRVDTAVQAVTVAKAGPAAREVTVARAVTVVKAGTAARPGTVAKAGTAARAGTVDRAPVRDTKATARDLDRGREVIKRPPVAANMLDTGAVAKAMAATGRARMRKAGAAEPARDTVPKEANTAADMVASKVGPESMAAMEVVTGATAAMAAV